MTKERAALACSPEGRSSQSREYTRPSRFRKPARQLPPFGKAQSRPPWFIGNPARIYIHDWDAARLDIADDMAALVLPYGAAPSDYRWPVRDRDCIVISDNVSADTVAELGSELIAYAARTVIMDYDTDQPLAIFNHTELQDAA